MGFFGGKLQPPRGGHGEARYLTDDRAKPTVPDAFFHAGQDCLVVTGLDIDNAVRFQAGLRQRRREQVGPGDAPQHFASRARRDAASKERRRRAINGAVAAACDFVQRAERQSAAREPCIELGDSERDHRFGAAAPAFDLLDPRAQRVYGGLGPQFGR